jgi:hypothetical protein
MYDILPKGATLASDSGAPRGKPSFQGRKENGRDFKKKGRHQQRQAPVKKGFRDQKQERPQAFAPARKPVPQQAPAPVKAAPAPVKAAPVKLTDEQKKLSGILREVSDDKKVARLVNTGGDVLSEVTVGSLADTLKDFEGDIDSVVFGGVISQRLLDIAVEKGVKNLVGIKKFNITKLPEGINVFTKDEISGE